jgi:hypothetical protein
VKVTNQLAKSEFWVQPINLMFTQKLAVKYFLFYNSRIFAGYLESQVAQAALTGSEGRR